MNREVIDIIESKKAIFVSYDGKNFETGAGMGVSPIISKIRQDKNYFSGKQIGDIVIGKAAALLLVLSGAKSVYGRIMSKAAIEIFKENNIEFKYSEVVEYIHNRTNTGLCPLEDSVKDENNPEKALEKIEERIKLLMKNK